MNNTEQNPDDSRPASEARWYCVSKDGRATLCADEADAIAEVARDTADWPLHAPYRAVQLADAAELAEAHQLALDDFDLRATQRDERDELLAEVERLRAVIAEWDKLRDPHALHVNLLRGFPARLARTVLLHLAGDEEPKF
jgi:predicted DCC family thiol-disulfide oxidoreductase YuxK